MMRMVVLDSMTQVLLVKTIARIADMAVGFLHLLVR